MDSQVIGSGAEGFQLAALVEYPSRRVFVESAASPEVAAIRVQRAASLRGAGHFVQEDAGAELARSALDFIARPPAA